MQRSSKGDGRNNSNAKKRKTKKNKRHLQDERALFETAGSSNSWILTGGDVAVKDAIIAPAPRRISRKTLDQAIISQASSDAPVYLKKVSLGDDKQGSLTCLQRACLRVIVDNIGREDVLDQLAEGTFPDRLLPHLARRVSAMKPEVPFYIYKRLAQTYQDLPLYFKTYSGIVFDDTEELQNLPLFDASFSFTPMVSIITLLDLSNTAFQKTDMYKIRVSLSGTLVALRLDNLTHLDDDSMTDLARGAGDGNAFIGLEILSLKGCNRITDRSAARFACYPALKMLDLRRTSCTSATKQILRSLSRPPFLSAFTSAHLGLFRPTDLATTARTLQQVSLAPLAKTSDDSSPILPDCAISPSLLITELTRLDPAQIRDPRNAVPHNEFHASHHAFGNVWTTRPIDSIKLREQGSEQSSEGAAFRQGHAAVMTGQLKMSQVDYGWKRKAGKKGKHLQEVQQEKEDFDDDSDLEDVLEEIKEETIAEPAEQSTFYTRPSLPPVLSESELPEKDELMLLRFFRTGEGSAERIVQPKRKREDDEAAVKISKTKINLKEVDILGDLLRAKRTSVETPLLTGSTVQNTQATQRSKPSGIVKTVGSNGGFGRKVVVR